MWQGLEGTGKWTGEIEKLPWSKMRTAAVTVFLQKDLQIEGHGVAARTTFVPERDWDCTLLANNGALHGPLYIYRPSARI